MHSDELTQIKKNKYKIFNEMFYNKLKKELNRKFNNKNQNKQEYTNEILKWRKSIFRKPGSGARGFEEPSGETVVKVRYRYIGNNKN